MSDLRCRLVCHSAGSHVQQIYTGLALLRRRGLIDLDQQIAPSGPRHADSAYHLRHAGDTHSRVILNERMTLHYDIHDSLEIDPQHLDHCEFYFKRSFSAEYVKSLPRHSAKVRPLGFNCHVLADFVDILALRRGLRIPRGGRRKFRALREALDPNNWIKFSTRLRDIESLPEDSDEPRVIFQVVAHDPHDDPRRSKAGVADRIATNDFRAACIRGLRQALGDRFQGGFNHNDTARELYPDLLVPDSRMTTKKNYLNTLRRYPICVATTGLHGSTGWKFAEYVAMSRAIVSERPKYSAPGTFRQGRNFVAFSSPDECVEQCQRLLDDSGLRRSLMVNNARYYQTHLRPDALVMNTLLAALFESGSH